MTFVPSLLQAIVTMDGEALVLHVGDKPYVITESGHITLASEPLTVQAVLGVVEHLLSHESRSVLDSVGATQFVLPENPLFPGERFSVVAARGGEDLWVEIRRTTLRREEHAEPPSLEERSVRAIPVDRYHQTLDTRESHSEPEVDAGFRPAIALPLTRTPLRGDVPPPLAEPALQGLDRLLRLAAARGASTLYLVSGERPSIRIDGEVRSLDGASILGSNEVEGLLLTLMPERSAEALRSGAAGEWTSEFSDLGRVKCLSFRDHRGPGGVFRIMPNRTVTTEQLGLSEEIQTLAGENDGLLIVTGPRLSGKRTLMSAFVDHINRTRQVHVITIEREISVVHERIGSMVSQREARDAERMAATVRSALREDPDVVVLEDISTATLVGLALEAAASGRMVICGYPARSATAAIDGIIDLSPSTERRYVQLALAQHLRGVVAQVLLKKAGGGRLAARELLLNTPAVASLLAEGKTSQLPLAIEGGRQHGMVPLNDALGGFAQSGAVDVSEVYRASADRAGLLALLHRQGIDTSMVERRA